MLKSLLQGEKLFLGLVSSNALLAALHAFLIKIQVELSAVLTILQIVVALLAIAHVVRKFFTSKKSKSNEIIPPPDSP